MKITKNFTIIPNELLENSQISLQARHLYCVLLRYAGQDEWCFPSQQTLASNLGYCTRHIRNLLNDLIEAGLLVKKRRGFNRSNNYKVTKSFTLDRNSSSPQLRSEFPLHNENTVPPKNTYLKGKGKKSIKGMQNLRNTVNQIRPEITFYKDNSTV